MKRCLVKAAAIAAGERRYSTGVPCKHGHVSDRLVSTGQCTECLSLRESTYDRKKYQERYRSSDHGGRVFRDGIRRSLARKSGHMPPPLESEWPPKPSDGKCQCCGEVRRLVADHCHKTGRWRGWICQWCNRGLGFLGDTLDTVQKLRTI